MLSFELIFIVRGSKMIDLKFIERNCEIFRNFSSFFKGETVALAFNVSTIIDIEKISKMLKFFTTPPRHLYLSTYTDETLSFTD